MDLQQDLREWHDFYLLMGAASGTLLGAMFVVASIGTGFLTADRADSVRTFITPTVMNVSFVLIACALLVTPAMVWWGLCVLTGFSGLGGLTYMALIGRKIWLRHIDPSDRFWHGFVPTAGCLVIMAASVLAALQRDAAVELLATALLVLLIAAIRNASDLIVFLVSRERQ
jgi:hypothetical protein